MDICIEEIVKKERTSKDKFLMFGLVALCVIATVVLYLVVIPVLVQFAPVIFLLIAAIVYITYLLSGEFNIEYEYSLVNYEMDIDKIASKKRRKRITSLNLQKIEVMGKKTSRAFEKNLNDAGVKKIFACKNKQDEDVYFLVYTEGAEKKMLVFSPGEKLIFAIEKLNPQKIAL